MPESKTSFPTDFPPPARPIARTRLLAAASLLAAVLGSSAALAEVREFRIVQYA